ncbi:UDP-N-acetylmuramate--L-alanine ligase [Clostridium facile]|uniref:UDP-N-acetylmuramate--L-alanine ligase n=1 Tax=Clostridium facile TaxID=2763035 RepID=A0ABR7IMX2_9CLOT|nr:UDP-N-acetylmuramate--L-alanine ligase [Clostridium facile]MBC5786472.1 UDP-N-acetylmuramate--L-alanine ligase [Clostridium facile]
MAEKSNLLQGKKHIHFIGIGGSGMFPLAQILHKEGYYLTGSDNNESDILKMVRALGIPVTMGQKAENIEGADLIVHTAAIMEDNPELIAAKASGVPTIERSVLLGIITERYSDCICVSGTHGKTTTTAMLTQILLDADMDPSAVIGGKLKSINSYGRSGDSEIMTCEACEFVDTFLHLSPDIAVVLNIDCDHMDYFKTMDNLKLSFEKFCNKASKAIIYNGDNENTVEVANRIQGKKKISYGIMDTNEYYPKNITHIDGLHTRYDLYHQGEFLTTLDIHVPGDHNIGNSVAACAAALEAGTPVEKLAKGLDAFKGAGRRFELLGKVNGVTIVDDYAHHPAEIAATLKAAKSLKFNQVWAVHQPFTYSRTKMLLDDFAEALSIADHTVLTEIMGSREKNTYHIYAKDLADKIDGCVWFPTQQEVADYVLQHAKAGDLVITLGCGDIYKAAKIMLNGHYE